MGGDKPRPYVIGTLRFVGEGFMPSRRTEKLGELCPPNPLAASLLYVALPAAAPAYAVACRRQRRALGRARKRARSQILRGLGGPGEVTSPLLSITSILNANGYKSIENVVNVDLEDVGFS